MGGKGGRKKGPNAAHVPQSRSSMTLREELTGKKQGNVNAKTMCKLDHIKNLAVWTANKASVPSLGAFFGQRLAATTEALGLRADPSVFVCERCESVLQPGQNCTVRIEKNKSKTRHRRKKSNLTTQNSVVYRCHFCSHRNLMRGTPKGYVKAICPPKAKPPSKSEPTTSAIEERTTILAKGTSGLAKVDTVALPEVVGQNLETSGPATPLPATCLSLLDSKRRKRSRSVAKKAAEPETDDAEKSLHESSKRRRKTWTSLKEIASSEHGKKLSNLTIPFFIK
ncbi:hypothetical protein BUALT_Bualt10G0049200 [Buddleja alternifolia]|uniref:Uncharacterized protein n=1 Tax=Buddleja alternifolia TaxID=168488 RepID=A0AAV6WW56_9LAMI|nr:hypothetical protein BUALT_Bualt10G0049200 [Buddleja alternifolia]